MPTLSAIIVSRNDGYGGTLSERASYCFNSFLHVADELVYVDWNSPEGDLASAIAGNLAAPLRHKVRVIKINADFVRQHVPGPAQACVEVVGRNIALRRVTGDWVVSTSVDIVAPPVPLEQLDDNAFYSWERTNVDIDRIAHIPFADYAAVRAQLEAIRPQLSPAGRCHNRYWLRRDKWSHWHCCGDFQLAHRRVWHAVRGFEQWLVGRNWMDTNIQKKVMLSGRKVIPQNDRLVCHINHPGGAGGGKGVMNDLRKAIYDFKQSSNTEDWGFPDLAIPEFRLC